jgi:hypothetical protein
VGDTLYVVPVSEADQAAREPRRLTDFEIVPVALGLLLRPFKDGLAVHAVNDVVLVSSPSGLLVTPEGMGAATLIGEADGDNNAEVERLFDFPNWRMGGLHKLNDNRRMIEGKIAAARSPEERAGLLMKLATLYFANNFGQETLGVLDLVLSENADMEKNPNFVAIRGAANAMAGHYKEAMQDLSFPAIQQHPEVKLWVGFASAASEEWRMADRSFPKNNRLLLQYPDNISVPFTIYMAESALHLGHTDMAIKLLNSINMSSETIDGRYQAAVGYLRGEAAAQAGKYDEAVRQWKPVAEGLDRLYHTKASLSLARFLFQQKKISLKDAVDQVDNLRFAWRGDGLEVNILQTLGALKVQNNQVLSGMEDMRQAAELEESMLNDATPIRDEMKQIFYNLFVSDQASKITPLEAVSVYTEFSSFMPPGPEGAAGALNFADYLIRMDLLLEKAEGVIEDQLKGSGIPKDKISALGAKLSAVYLLDAKPQQALTALAESERSDLTDKLREERTLLKARAQSQLNQTQAAIGTLGTLGSRNAQKLKADVFWKAQKWSEAAEATEVLLPDPGKQVTEEDAGFVVDAAVAWKLAGNVEKLKEIKVKYEPGMKGKKLEDTFGVVTRDGGASALADRESILKIAGEVDMFKGFLDNYKAGTGGS